MPTVFQAKMWTSISDSAWLLGVYIKVRLTDLETKKEHTKIWIVEVKQEIYDLVYALEGRKIIHVIVTQSETRLCMLRNGTAKASAHRALQTYATGLQ